MDIEEAREILITLGANADKRLKFSERHALAKYLELRDELEQQLAELREAVDEVLNASVSSLEYRSNRLQLAVWDLRAVRDKALLQESSDE